MLHVTNGDHAAGLLRRAGLGGDVLAWQDALHEGPVPAGLDAAQLRAVRARFLDERGWAAAAMAEEDFAARDERLQRETNEFVAWFDADLYDQLQLLQVLDAVSGGQRVSLVDLGYGTTERDLPGRFASRRRLGVAELALAARAWQAFRSPDPGVLGDLLDSDLGANAPSSAEPTALPHLAAALSRHLEQFPDVDRGLARTERQILEVVAEGARDPGAIFRAEQGREDPVFMGDTTLYFYLARLCREPEPLLELTAGGAFLEPHECAGRRRFLGQRLGLTRNGRAVLDGRADWVALAGIDRWLGGVHLCGAQAAWRWNPRAGRLQPEAGRS